jgi:hypothetical protein
MLADACVPDLASLVIADVMRLENFTGKSRPERFEIGIGHGRDRIVLHIQPSWSLTTANWAERTALARLPISFTLTK